MARSNKYDELNIEDKLDSIQGWAKNGSTDEEIAKMLGIGLTLYYEWKKTKPKFAKAIKKGKEVSNGELLNSAFQQSTGYYIPEDIVVKLKTTEIINDKVYYIEKVEVVPTMKYVPPNPTMNIFMLKNRLPSEYRDKQEVEAINHNLNQDVGTLSPEDRKKRIEELKKKLDNE